ncbi:MAG: glycoside hydrolase family 57 protein [Bacteroidales bacterium]|nr:glycoside hydrolase family 57 protein [Bacteroidales bacterium]
MATKSICLYFQVHQPTRLRLYRFFDIGKDSHYYDDFANRTILRRVAQKCYLPMNQLMLELINKNKGKFKICYSISGSALDQFQRFCPEVIDSFKALAATGRVEFLAETYYHSLASLGSDSEFKHQVAKHAAKIEELFGVKPVAFRNTELIYSNSIGEIVYEMGYKTMLTEGARHIMGWQSPNYVYTAETQPKLKLLLRNYVLSDDIAFRFSQNKVTAQQYVGWMKDNAKEGDIVNLFMDYETFGEHQSPDSGIFEFMRALPDAVLKDGTFGFVTPSEATKKYKPVSDIAVEDPISWADEERDVTAWLGNELQSEAFKKVYAMKEKLAIVNDPDLYEDWGHLQESDHFYYMCTKFFSDGEVHKYFNPYDTPYEAFINYMNVISDFQIRLDEKRAALDVRETAAQEFEAPKPVRKKVAKKK